MSNDNECNGGRASNILAFKCPVDTDGDPGVSERHRQLLERASLNISLGDFAEPLLQFASDNGLSQHSFNVNVGDKLYRVSVEQLLTERDLLE